MDEKMIVSQEKNLEEFKAIKDTANSSKFKLK